jgi:hypothetical protein
MFIYSNKRSILYVYPVIKGIGRKAKHVREREREREMFSFLHKSVNVTTF